jgi:hypothetical protein
VQVHDKLSSFYLLAAISHQQNHHQHHHHRPSPSPPPSSLLLLSSSGSLRSPSSHQCRESAPGESVGMKLGPASIATPAPPSGYDTTSCRAEICRAASSLYNYTLGRGTNSGKPGSHSTHPPQGVCFVLARPSISCSNLESKLTQDPYALCTHHENRHTASPCLLFLSQGSNSTAAAGAADHPTAMAHEQKHRSDLQRGPHYDSAITPAN